MVERHPCPPKNETKAVQFCFTSIKPTQSTALLQSIQITKTMSTDARSNRTTRGGTQNRKAAANKKKTSTEVPDLGACLKKVEELQSSLRVTTRGLEENSALVSKLEKAVDDMKGIVRYLEKNAITTDDFHVTDMAEEGEEDHDEKEEQRERKKALKSAFGDGSQGKVSEEMKRELDKIITKKLDELLKENSINQKTNSQPKEGYGAYQKLSDLKTDGGVTRNLIHR